MLFFQKELVLLQMPKAKTFENAKVFFYFHWQRILISYYIYDFTAL